MCNECSLRTIRKLHCCICDAILKMIELTDCIYICFIFCYFSEIYLLVWLITKGKNSIFIFQTVLTRQFTLVKTTCNFWRLHAKVHAIKHCRKHIAISRLALPQIILDVCVTQVCRHASRVFSLVCDRNVLVAKQSLFLTHVSVTLWGNATGYWAFWPVYRALIIVTVMHYAIEKHKTVRKSNANNNCFKRLPFDLYVN